MAFEKRMSMLSVGLVLVFCGVVCASAAVGRCKPKRYTHKAMQTDLNGRRCWDDVKIMSCWGYCLSYEISDWQFPYKESHHPVCVHGERRHASLKLRHCDPNVEPGTDVYHYVEATSCRCQADNADYLFEMLSVTAVNACNHKKYPGGIRRGEPCAKKLCSSEDTSCEWLPPDTSILGGLILREELEEELE